QASAFDGAAAYLVDEILLEGGRYSTAATFEGYVFKPHTDGVAVYHWDSVENAWARRDAISLGASPSDLEVVEGRLFAQSGSVVDVVAVDQLPETPARERFTIHGPSYGTRLD